MLIQQKGLFSIYAAVAQLAELVPSKHDVAGSSPVDGSIQFQNDFAMKGVVAWGMLIRWLIVIAITLKNYILQIAFK